VNLLSYTPQNWRLMLSIYLMRHAEIADDLPKKKSRPHEDEVRKISDMCTGNHVMQALPNVYLGGSINRGTTKWMVYN
jgi:hypothetical protein